MTNKNDDLFSLLGDERKLALKIEKEFSEIEEPFQALLVAGKDHFTINIHLLKYLIKRIGTGVYITVNHPMDSFKPKLEKAGVDLSKLAFVDGITKQSQGRMLEGENFYYTESPKDLVDLNFLLDKALKKLPEKKFVLIDSITTLLIYNDLQVVEKFMHAMVGKMRSSETSAVFIISSRVEEEVTDLLAQFCDKVVEL